MALPVIGVAVALLRANTAAKLFGGAGKDTAGAVGNIRLKVSWAKGGRGIRKAERRMAASAKRAALKAANATGKELYVELVKTMASEAGASEAAIKKTLIRKAASTRQRGKPVYSIKVRPGRAGQVPNQALKSAAFSRKKKRASSSGRGRLKFKGLRGKIVDLPGIVRVGKGRGAGYAFPETRKRRGRSVGGLKFKYRQTPKIERLRKTTKPKFKRHFRQAMKATRRR